MIRCARCVMPNTRPDTPFVDGVCQACINYSRRPEVDWHQRGVQMAELLDRHHGECIVPSSGGKDSTYQAIKLKAMGAHVTAVTARTCHLTPIGRANIDNLARHVRTIEVTPNMTVRAKLNRIGLEMVGDISWPEHVSIFTTPLRMAAELGIPLIFYGENPQDQYGGPLGSEEARQLTLRWRSEYGGFLGLRPHDLIGREGLTERDLYDYRVDVPLNNHSPREGGFEAHFLGAYLPWDSHDNAEQAIKAGMRTANERPAAANWWQWENLDNAQTGLHDYLMYRKYGFGRGCAQISVDVRAGRISRQAALEWIASHDGLFPCRYMGEDYLDILGRIGVTDGHWWRTAGHFTNWELFTPVGDQAILKE